MMKKILLILFIGVFTLNIYAQRSGLGVGVILGEPTGISVKSWTGSKTAIDAAAAWSLQGEGAFHVHADMLVHNFNILKPNKGQMPLYLGLGAKVVLLSDLEMGVRVPIGFDYLFPSAPFDLFIEAVPTLNILPATEFDINGGVGLRIWF